ncbi:MAG: AAA family ATPase, partial [Desulfatiglandaceae bacterium]
MYSAYFGLSENPFALTPDPRFLFLSHRHKEALAHLLYGMGERGGFVLLTGEVGTGKTTLCRSVLEQVPEGVEVALVLNPKQTALELVGSVCDELHVSYPPGTESIKVLVDQLNLHLLETHSRGGRTALIIDEAQNLSIDVLEQVRLLTNLETTRQKLLQILLIGQPELQDMMARPELR